MNARWRLVPLLILTGLALSSCNGLDMILARVRDLCRDEIVVTRTEDTNGVCTADDCSLREAVTLSNACPGTQAIRIPAGLYTLTLLGTGTDLLARWGDLDITDSVQIEGEGNPILDGNQADRVFDVFPGTTVDMTGFTVQHGRSDGGGGIRSYGALSLHTMILQENTTDGGSGGGILRLDGTLYMEGSQVIGNSAYQGGGIAADPSGESATLHAVEILDTVIVGNSAHRGGGLYLWLYAPATANLTNVEIRDNTSDVTGGGLMSEATVNLEEVRIQGNHAGFGGGISNYETGTMTAYHVLIENNLAGSSAGGVFNLGVAHIAQSAIVNNRAEGGEAGGVFNRHADAHLSIDNSTISGNQGDGLVNTGMFGMSYTTVADNTGAGVKTHGSSRIENSILAGNLGGDCEGGVTLGSHNIEGTNACGFSDPSNLVNTDPRLMPLGLHGGTTPIHPLAPGSPAVDAGGPECPDIDQRGVARPLGPACDIGAYELQPPFDVPPTADSFPGLAPTPPLSATFPLPTPTSPPEPVSASLATFLQTGNCRSGPGGVYGVVTSYPQGTQVTLEGRNSDSTWWWVLMPGAGGHCFASGSVLELSGPTALLPIIAAPPTPTTAPSSTPSLQPPAAPNKVAISSRVCTSQAYKVTLGWIDTASNETGFRVYRNGNLIATLGVNATGYTDGPPYGGPYTYGVEAFNAAGTSGRPTVVESGCIT